MTIEIRVGDATCGHCKSAVESAVAALTDVESADLDLDSKRLRVEHSGSVSVEEVWSAISASGYTPEPPA
jgi:copper chaperone